MRSAAVCSTRLGRAFCLLLVCASAWLAGCQHGSEAAHRSAQAQLGEASMPTRILAAYEPWFGTPEHINVGYSGQDPSTLARQIREAKRMGIYGFVVDWYGTRVPAYDHSYAMLQNLAAQMDFRTALLYEEREGHDDSATQEAIDALEYAYKRYIGPDAPSQQAYLTYHGRPMIFLFPKGGGTDWEAVRHHVEQWPTPPLLIMEFREHGDVNAFDGFYAWVSPGEPGWKADGSNWGRSYLENFYVKMRDRFPDKIAVGGAWPGFNDAKASWGQNRRMDPQCGRVLDDTLRFYHRYYTDAHPLPFLMVETWNDYEEGTAVEHGVQTCTGPPQVPQLNAGTAE